MIPKRVHQTWKTSVVPERWASSVQKYQALVAEGWEYRLWTDADNRQLIAEHYPWFLAQFDAYPYPIQRADAVRYFILYHYGGIYSDLDIQPKKNFTAFYELYKEAELALPCTKAGNGVGSQNFSNCFMMSAPQCAFWPLVWEHLKQPFQKAAWWKAWLGRAHYFQILFTTGPGIICDTVPEYTGALVALPAQLIQPGVEADQPPVSRPESVVELLKGESWQQGDAVFWRSCGTAINNATWIAFGVCVLLLLVILCQAVVLARRQKALVAAQAELARWSSSSRRAKSTAGW